MATETNLDAALDAAAEMFGGVMKDEVAHLNFLIVELTMAAKALLLTTTEERQEPAVWFPRVDRLRAAIAKAVQS